MLKQKSKTPTFISRGLLLVASLAVLAIGLSPLVAQQKTALAATNDTINFQARLLTAAGNVVPDGQYNVEFKLYAVAENGTALWTETRIDANKVTVKNGYLTVNLGSVTSFGAGINWDQELWLTMNIGGTGSPSWDGEMNPRLKLTSVPYAFRSGAVVSADGSSVLTAANGETGTICVRNSVNCGFVQGAATDFIQNTTSAQTANLFIQSANAANVAAVIQGAASQTADIFQVQNSTGSTVLAVKSSGSINISNVDSTQAFNIQTTSANNLFTVDTTNSRVGINLGGTATPSLATNVSGLEVKGAIRLSGTGINYYDEFVTPKTGTPDTVRARFSIVADEPGQYQQLMALGVKSTAHYQSRALSLFDARTTAHDPTLAVFSPDENNSVGFTWNGTSNNATVQTSNNSASSSTITLQSGNVTGGSTGSSGDAYVLTGSINSTGYTTGSLYLRTGNGAGTNNSTGNIVMDVGAKTGTGTAGTITIGGTNASTVTIGNTNSTVTVQGSNSASAFRVLNQTGVAFLTVNTSGTRPGIIINGTGTNGAGGRLYFGASDGNYETYVGESGTGDSNVLALRGTTAVSVLAGTTETEVASFNQNGLVVLKAASDFGGFIAKDTGGAQLFRVAPGTTGSNRGAVHIGDEGWGTLVTQLVLDSKVYDGGVDPAGMNGGMYYSVERGKFRCYEADAWVDCINSEAFDSSSVIQNQAASPQAANFFIQSANAASVGGIVRGASGQTADIFQVQNSAGNSWLSVTAGGITNINTTVSITGSGAGTVPLTVKANSGSGNGDLILEVRNPGDASVLRIDGTGTLAIGNAAGLAGQLAIGNGTAYGQIRSNLLTGTLAYDLPNENGVICLQAKISCGFILNDATFDGTVRTLTLGGAGLIDFVTPKPGGGSVKTKLNIPYFDPGTYGDYNQVVAMGIPDSTNATSRVLSLFDGRKNGAHQPTLIVFDPDQNDGLGFSWEGQSAVGYLKSLSANIGIRAGTTDIALFGSTGIDLFQHTATAAGKNFTVGAGGTLRATTIDAGAGGQSIDIGGTNALGINLNESTAITGSTSGNTLTVSNSTSTGNIAVFRDNATDVVTLADGGAFALKNSVNSGFAFTIDGAGANAPLMRVDTSQRKVAIGAYTSSDINAQLEILPTHTGRAGLLISGTAGYSAMFIQAQTAGANIFSVSGNGDIVTASGVIATNSSSTNSSSMSIASGNATGASGDSGVVTVRSGASSGGSTGGVTIMSGSVTAGTGSSGSITVDAGSVQSGTAGGVYIGTSNATSITLGTTAKAQTITIGSTNGASETRIYSGTGGTTFKGTNDDAAFRILNGSDVPLFNVDSTNSRVYIGNPTADATGALLVLDNKNDPGDPATTGTPGAMYYNSSSNSFRCYSTAWGDCGPRVGKVSGSDISTSGSTGANATGLGFSVAANTDYAFTCTLVFSSSASNAGMMVGFTTPASPTSLDFSADIPPGSAGDNTGNFHGNVPGTLYGSQSPPVGGGGTKAVATIKGVLRNGANAGTLQLQYARSANNSATITLYVGSSCEVRQL